MKRFHLFLFCLLGLFRISLAQNVGIGTTNPNQSAVLDLTSTTKGFLPPRMSTALRMTIPNPVAGLMVYDTNTDSYWYFDNGKWNELINTTKLATQIPTDRIDPSGGAGDNFGFSVCLGSTGTQGYIGSPMLGNGGNGACFRVALADNNLWTINNLVTGSLSPGDAFGYSVAMDRVNNGNVGIVSAPFDDSSTVTSMGSAYLFEAQSFVQKIYAPLSGRVTNAKFGRSVDISGNASSSYALVGAPGANSGKGAAYLYQYNPNTSLWDFEATFSDNLGAVADSFGLSVSLYYNVAGDTAWAFIGAPYDDENSITDIGSVTVYRKAAASATWTRMAKIVPNESDDVAFGYAIDNVMRCGLVQIGGPLKSTGIGKMYSASLSSLGVGSASFVVSNMPVPGGSAGVGTPGLGFKISAMGTSSISCDIYALASSFSGIITSNSAASFGFSLLYHYSNGSWTLLEKLTDPGVETTGYGFGRAISIHTGSKYMIVGSPNERVDGMSSRGKVQFRKLSF